MLNEFKRTGNVLCVFKCYLFCHAFVYFNFCAVQWNMMHLKLHPYLFKCILLSQPTVYKIFVLLKYSERKLDNRKHPDYYGIHCEQMTLNSGNSKSCILQLSILCINTLLRINFRKDIFYASFVHHCLFVHPPSLVSLSCTEAKGFFAPYLFLGKGLFSFTS